MGASFNIFNVEDQVKNAVVKLMKPSRINRLKELNLIKLSQKTETNIIESKTELNFVGSIDKTRQVEL